MSLRRKVVLGVLFDSQGKILFMKRASDEKTNPNIWGFIGGGVDLGESLSEALKREIEEEGGISISGFQFVRKYDHEGVEINIMTKEMDSEEPKLTLNKEHDDYGWFDGDNLPSPVFPQTDMNIKKSKEILEGVLAESLKDLKQLIIQNQRSKLL